MTATNYTFNPPEARILVGESVTWTNAGGTHNVASATGLFRTEVSGDPWQFKYTFKTAGSYSYVCQQHQYGGYGLPGMVGSVQVRSSNAPPTVEIVSPPAGTVFAANDPKTLVANASDDGLISQIEFFDGERSVGVVRTSPFSLPVTLSPGSHTIIATATDDNGAVTSSQGVHFEVSPNHRPTISVASPSPDTFFIRPEPITFTVHVSDEEGAIAKVEYFNLLSNDQLKSIAIVQSAPFDLPAAPLDPGVATITAVVTDSGGLSSTSAPVRLFVSDRIQLKALREQPGMLTFQTSSTYGMVTFQMSTDLRANNWVDAGVGSPGGGLLQDSVRINQSQMFIRAKVDK